MALGEDLGMSGVGMGQVGIGGTTPGVTTTPGSMPSIMLYIPKWWEHIENQILLAGLTGIVATLGIGSFLYMKESV